jgi:hypothetical protein
MRSWTVYERVRSPDIEGRDYPTLPLALSPVNQIVIPFCCRKFTLSSLLTDPGESISDRRRNVLDRREPGWNVILVAITDARRLREKAQLIVKERTKSRMGKSSPKLNWLELRFLTRDLGKEACH